VTKADQWRLKPLTQSLPYSDYSFSGVAKKKILSVLGEGGRGKIIRVMFEKAKSIVPQGKTCCVKSFPATMMNTSSNRGVKPSDTV
jgi:hypothetical protein